MPQNHEDVLVGTLASLFSIPAGTEVATLAPVTGAKFYGWTTTEGATITPESTSTPIRANGGDIPRILKTEASVKLKVTLMESTQIVHDLAFSGKEVAGVRDWDPQARVRFTGCLDCLDYDAEGNVKTFLRFFIENAEVTTVDPVTVNDSQEIRYGIELTCYRTNGRCMRIIREVPSGV